MKIKFNDLHAQYLQIKEGISDKIEEFFSSESYIDGKYVRKFENDFSDFTDRRYSIGVSNGTDGLKLGIQTLREPGMNRVLIPANTFIADALAVIHQLNQDVYSFDIKLIDCDEYYQINIDSLKRELENEKDVNTILIAVHMYGHPCDMKSIKELKDQYKFKLMEDASQAHGAESNFGKVGSLGELTVYSLYPGKNLGAFGDAGIITTDDEKIYQEISSLRNYGSVDKYVYDKFGWNNRMDGIQALFLSEKIKFIEDWNDKRKVVADLYTEELSDLDFVTLPKNSEYCVKNVYHIFCIRVKDRENLQSFLSGKNIPTIIHYPIPIEKTKVFEYLNNGDNINTIDWSNEILSLPIHPFMSKEEVSYICENIKEFYKINIL